MLLVPISAYANWLAKLRLSVFVMIAVVWTPIDAQDDSKTAPSLIKRGPDVVLRETPERTIYEYRQNGQLTMIKVVPKKGKPYFLVPVDRTENDGELVRATRLKPQWVIKAF